MTEERLPELGIIHKIAEDRKILVLSVKKAANDDFSYHVLAKSYNESKYIVCLYDKNKQDFHSSTTYTDTVQAFSEYHGRS